MSKEDDLYYRIQMPNRDKYMSICTVQWFDEFDYDQRFWLKDDEGEDLMFDSYEDAQFFLNTQIEEEYIRPEDALYENLQKKFFR